MGKQELIILQGLPASGKTTYAKNWVNKAPKERIRVNRDDIRKMLGPYWVPSRESLVTEIENLTIIESLISNYSVIIDATNFKTASRFEELPFINDIEDIDIKIKFINTSLEECIKRDSERENKVGKEVIIKFYNKYLK